MDDLTDKNLFSYCDSNPVNGVDETGYIWETIFDIASIGWSIYDLVKKPSLKNVGYLAWDVGATIVPFVPGSYTAKGLKIVTKLDDVKVVAKIGKTGKITKMLDVQENKIGLGKLQKMTRFHQQLEEK
ncbi:hypothetical protein [uncultured Clostridium sp.]|uniref:hypothetical protein n=1 Tax=uncultured Clostridium sp. TaxID=59620 RepID=UPI0025F5D530|nr:hypothetical protein [uncultured Clostridium sp.]